MKRSFFAVAVLFSVSLLGCGGSDVEVQSEDPATASVESALCSSGTPACEQLDLTQCPKSGLQMNCCAFGNTYSCSCFAGVWACP